MSGMKSIAVFGGTFNPIHNGHVRIAQSIADLAGFDRVLLIPTNLPPHKQAGDTAAPEHRLEMCRLAAECSPVFEVSDMEIRRAGKSYTVATLEELCSENPDARLSLIIGGDMLLTFRQWFRYGEILRLADLYAAARREGEQRELEDYAETLRKEGGTVRIVPVPVTEVSSTEIRERVSRGLSVDSLVPAAVARYIAEKGLYRNDG